MAVVHENVSIPAVSTSCKSGFNEMAKSGLKSGSAPADLIGLDGMRVQRQGKRVVRSPDPSAPVGSRFLSSH